MSANAGSWTVLGYESNGGCSEYFAQHWGSGTSVAKAGVFHPLTSLAMIAGGIHVWFESATYPIDGASVVAAPPTG
jgi:hypothetical protein